MAVGRLTPAATELEYVQAWVGAGQAGGDRLQALLDEAARAPIT